MNYMNFLDASCKNCYKCLRSCPVKAIKFNNQQAKIVEERCIGCGHCLEVCPQNARKIVSDLEKVKTLLQYNRKIVASIAPSFPGYFNMAPGKVIASLKKIGFSIVEETAVGAEIVSDCYKDYIKENKLENYITTCCPSANYLIEKYFPSLVKNMLPIVSPMIAHGKMLKEVYGEDTFVVFIGPCAAKMIEAHGINKKKIIDAVLTFDEVENWILKSDIDLDELQEEDADSSVCERGRSYPVGNGISAGIKDTLKDENLQEICVSGTEECISLLKSMEKGSLKSSFVEINVCKGSCVGGPDMINNNQDYYKKLSKVKEYIEQKKNSSYKNKELGDKESYIQNDNGKEDINENKHMNKNFNIDFHRSFKDKNVFTEEINEEKIQNALREMGKFEEKDELNCGVCGYNTCREKAKAICQGMAESDMCLHFMRSKAESLSNVIFEHTPSIVILLDDELNIKEINPAAQEVFMINDESIKGKPISVLMDDNDFKIVRDTGKSIIGKRYDYPQYNAILIQNIVYLPKQGLVLASMINIMEEEKNRIELVRVKEETLNAAQEVIDKQMRVAQEIAGLLGETTAETKSTLNKLRKIVAGEGKHY